MEARVLTAAQAEVLGCEDGCVRVTTGYKLFVEGLDSLKAVHSCVEDLVDRTLVE